MKCYYCMKKIPADQKLVYQDDNGTLCDHCNEELNPTADIVDIKLRVRNIYNWIMTMDLDVKTFGEHINNPDVKLEYGKFMRDLNNIKDKIVEFKDELEI